ncbi:hypothetical protein [Mesonia aestuariivivens]|uniref:DUF3575 domain-containing protein n=1 Tax=Mesonia aestuariivivens TaxID=2796128 RepID=A0ABS6W074_9FLAO|nr:hypothetical protein [Mesonia aestuariivivens]MBW2961246.1 hypothetical protein [Mesonia aestuariivivens]
MKRILLFLLFICFSTLAQTEKLKGDIITFDLISPYYFHYYGFDHSTPRWRLGYIKELNEQRKLGVEFGFGHSTISLLNTGERYALVEIRPQYYFILNSKKKANFYTSIEAFYIYHFEEFDRENFFNKERIYLSFEQANYHRQKFGVVGNLGWFWTTGTHLGLNFYTGVGIKFRHNDYTNFKDLAFKSFDEEHFPPYYRDEGLKFNAEFSLGLKLYYNHKKNN